MRVSKLPERLQQQLARAGTRVTVEHPGVSYTGTGGDLQALWRAFAILLEEPADEPFRYDGELQRVRHELLQFEAFSAGDFGLMFERHFTYTEWGDIVGFSAWMTFGADPAWDGLNTVVQRDRESAADVKAWSEEVEQSAAFRATSGRTAKSFGFALDGVG